LSLRKTGIGVLVALALVFGARFAASELGGEVVTLTTFDSEGEPYETSLWIVHDDGSLWLRAGNPGSSWLARIRLDPKVEVTRAGETVAYRAEIVLDRRDRINRKMADAYGWADTLIGAMRESESTQPVRLIRAEHWGHRLNED
jgi:hypothetical protein